ncbi:hypothetical protein ES708_28287 [subsurface metagenome]
MNPRFHGDIPCGNAGIFEAHHPLPTKGIITETAKHLNLCSRPCRSYCLVSPFATGECHEFTASNCFSCCGKHINICHEVRIDATENQYSSLQVYRPFAKIRLTLTAKALC